MKVLFLVEMQQDYGEFFLFQGLCELLGEDSIILYPFKLSYMGFRDSAYILYQHGNKRGMTNPPAYVKPRNLRIYPMEEIIDEMPSIDFIVLTSPRYYPVHALRFIKHLYSKIPKPLVFTDFEDTPEICYDLIDEFKPKIIFKRELIKPIESIYPLPFSSPIPYLSESFDDQNKTLDLFCALGYTCELRREVIDFLIEKRFTDKAYLALDIPALRLNGKYPSMLSYNEYLKAIASSKIAVCLRGHGRDTVRYWEIPSFETLFLLKDPGIIIPNPFEDGQNCVKFDTLNDLEEKINYFLSHDEERIRIAKAGKEHLENFHTNEKRATYFLEIVKKYL